ncbi:MAG: hypothetical protein IKU61_03040 [Clostridia bacterium]|nr:hypothetical protein [Clostridia bacterium]
MFLLKNTYSKKEFLIDTVFYSLVLLCAFCNICFVSLPGLSVVESKCILFATLVLVSAICTALSYIRGRNCVSIWVNALIPLELYAVVSYMPYFKKEIVLLLCITGVAALAFVVIMFTAKKIKLKWRLLASAAGVRAIVALCMLLLILPVGIKTMFGHGLLLAKTETVDGYEDAYEWTVQNKLDILMLLNEDRWKKADVRAKTEVLATVKNIEIANNDIDHEIYFEVCELKNGELAVYEPRQHRIKIDVKHIQNDSAKECLNSVLHECYHAYQYMLAEAYVGLPDRFKNMRDFGIAANYAREFCDYNDGKHDLFGYSNQLSEIMAREYAEKTAEKYYTEIGG